MKEQQKLIKSIALVLIVAIPVIILLSKNVKTTQKEENKKTKSLLSAVLKKNNQTQEEANYKKFVSGEVLNENTSFLEYAFITNNTAYIFNPAKLKTGELSYKKAYDIPNNIKVMNIVPSLGADINFIDYTDTLYSIYDNNIDNDPVDDYSMFEKATYELKTLATNNYSEKYLDKKWLMILRLITSM